MSKPKSEWMQAASMIVSAWSGVWRSDSDSLVRDFAKHLALPRDDFGSKTVIQYAIDSWHYDALALLRNERKLRMSNYNKVLLMGNLTRDIELKHTPSNLAVAHIGIAVNRKYRTKDGETREDVTFVDCEAWGKTAEMMNQYLSKGSPVFIEGRLKLDQWEQDGQNRSKLKIVVESFTFVGGKSDAKPEQTPQPSSVGGGGGSVGGGGGSVGDEDIPFIY